MSLARIIGLHTLAVLVGLLVVSGVALWGLDGLRNDYGQALAGYEQLRDAYEIGSRVETTRVLMAGRDLGRATDELREMSDRLDAGRGASFDRTGDVRLSIGRALRLLTQGGLENGSAARVELNRVLSKLATVSADVRREVEARQRTAEAKRDTALKWVGAVCFIVIVGSVLVAWSLYRSVTLPVARLTRVAEQLAAGRFDGRVSNGRGPTELVELGKQFDRMADELLELYKNLEERVQQTGRRLVRSEHLAGVGALAAGVAHEINNPLGIISGYAQMMTRDLAPQNPSEAPSTEALQSSLRVIIDEAFRCKKIVEKLLTLSRVGVGPRARVDLAALVHAVVTSLRDSGVLRERTVEVDVTPTDVLADAGELRQVMLNVLVNAIEATTPTGTIRVSVNPSETDAAIVVQDGGVGMDAQAIARALEPFFSDLQGKQASTDEPAHGTGLGLSLCDAIVRAHGGSIAVTSDGRGRGTSVVVRLPVIGQSKDSKPPEAGVE